jgi:hypothetical protein
MRKSTTRLLLVLALATAGAVLAHGGGKHLMGIVESVAAGQIVVKDRDGGTHHVRLDQDTRYRDTAGTAAYPSEIRSGDRVVVHLGIDAKASTALEVRFGRPAPPPEGR